MIYHVMTFTEIDDNIEEHLELWALNGKRLDTIRHNREVWAVTCHDEHDFAAMQDAADAWEAKGNGWEQLGTPWHSEESGARV